MKRAITLLVVLLLSRFGMAGGHGPVFGLATPTNSQGEWSFDQGVFGRTTSVGSQASDSRTCGIRCYTASHAFIHTPSRSWRYASFAYQNSAGRRFRHDSGMAISTQGNEGGHSNREHRLRWFRRSRPAVCFRGRCRTHRTFPVSWLVQSQDEPLSATTYGSELRSRKFAEHDGDRRPDVFDYSLVYGYRPPKWRRTPDKWDWRLFGELVGERSNKFQQANAAVSDTASAPSLSRPVSTWNLSQLHDQLRCSVPDISGRRCCMAERARAFRSQFQLSAIPALTLGDEMKNANCAVCDLLLLAASASAEIKSIDIKIFGMD